MERHIFLGVDIGKSAHYAVRVDQPSGAAVLLLSVGAVLPADFPGPEAND